MEQSVLTTPMHCLFGNISNVYLVGKRLFKKTSASVGLLAFLFLSLAFAGQVSAQAPAIASFSPQNGSVGTLVAITGSNLSSPTAFTIGGQTAIVVSNTGSTLVGLVMPNATSGAVSLTTAGGTASGSGNFTITTATPPTAQQGAKLTESGGSFAQLGASVALSADGLTALVGAPQDNGHGDAVVYTWSGNAWTQSAVLTGAGSSGSFFGGAGEGRSVALSADGNTAAVGGSQDNNNEGAFWVFTRSGNSWTQQSGKIVATKTDGGTFDSQGTSVSISADGNTLVEGGTGANSGNGAAWVFTRSSGAWTQAAELTGTGIGTGLANQGSSVAISADGGTVLMAGKADNNDRGAVWVFTGSGSSWTQQGTKLTPSDANTGGGGPYFGTSTALSADGNTAIIGGPADASLKGASWIFTRSGSTWSQQGSKLFGTAAVGQSQQGWSVAISADGNTAIEGGLEDNNSVGASWVFTRSGSAWTQQGGKLVGTGASGSGSQGSSVAIAATGQTAIEGASVDNGGIGAAWVFTGSQAPTAPAIQASNVQFTSTDQTSTIANWTAGNGTSEAVFISQSSSGSPSPANNTTYNANAAFASGDQIGSTGWYCVFNGTGTSVNITGLTANTAYTVMAVDYNGTAGGEQYLTTTGTGNPATLTTSVAPTTVVSITQVGTSPTSATTLDYTVTFADALTTPPSTSDFSLSNSVGVTGTINSVTASGTDGTTYDVNVTNVSGNGTLELDMTSGTDAVPTISNIPFSGGAYNVIGVPTIQASNVTFNNTKATSTTINWTPGNGTSEAVFVSPGSLPISLANNTTYQGNTQVGQGSTEGSGDWYCVYDGSGSSSVNVTGLNGNSSFNVMVVDYNGTPGSEQYLTATANGNPATLTTPPVTFTVDRGASSTQDDGMGDIDEYLYFLSGDGMTDLPVGGLGSGNFSLSTTGSNLNASIRDMRQQPDGSWHISINYSGTSGGSVTLAMVNSNGTHPTVAGLPVTLFNNPIQPTPSPVINGIDNPSVSTTSTGPVSYTVHYSDNASGVALSVNADASKVNLNLTGTAKVGSVSINDNGDGSSYTVTLDQITGNGTVGISLSGGTVEDDNNNLFDGGSGSSATFAVVNQTTINSISAVTSTAAPTNAAFVDYNVTFGAAVSGLSASNFSLNTTGATTGASIFSITTKDNITYDVTVGTGTGSGTIQLQLANATGLTLGISNTLPFNGDTYTFSAGPRGLIDLFINGTSGSQTTANVGDEIDLYFEATGAATMSASVDGGNPANVQIFPYYGNWLAVYNMKSTDPTGPITEVVTLSDASGNSTRLTASGITLLNGATPPTNQAGNVTFTNVATTGTTINWTSGNGVGEVVFIGPADTLQSTPPAITNGTTYTANATYRLGAGDGNGYYCVYNGTGNSMGTNSLSIDHLVTGEKYNVYVFDYNGTPGSELYLTTAGTGNPATVTTTVPPITAVISAPSSTETSTGPVTFAVTYSGGDPGTFQSFLTAADLGGNTSGTVNFSTQTNGSGDNYTITIANITGNGTFSVSTPGGEARDGDGNQDPGTNSATVNVDNAITLKSITATSSAPTTGPTVQYTVTFSDYVGNLTLNNFTVATTSGNATGIINNVTNNGDNTYSVTIGNITGSGTLQLQLSSTNGLTNINNTTGLINPSLPFLGDSYTILPNAPTTQASNVTVTNTSQTGTTINWAPGNGASEAVFLENSSVHGSPSPVNNTMYNANATFRSGDQIGGTGWYCVYNGTGSSSVSVTGLSAGSPYQVMVVDYNGAPGGEQYSTATASGNPLAFPTLSAPQLFTGTASGTISACVGTASASPNVEHFTVSGSNLTDNITVTAPSGGAFELSTDGTTYSSSVTLTQLSGSVSNVTVFARSAASDGAGAISGNAVVSTVGATSVNVALSGTVNALATVAAISNQTVGAGAATTAVAFSGTAGSYTWTNNTPGIGLAASGTGNFASFNAANTGTSPVTATITATPIGGYSYAYIANNGSNNVSVINTAGNAVIATIQVGPAPWGVATNPDGKTVYVTNSGDGTVSVINTATNTVVGAPITVGANPEGIAVSPDGSTVYVVNNGAGAVSVISTATNSVIHTITTGGTPTNVIVNNNGSALYVVRGASVVEYSTSNYTLIKNEGAFDLATDIALSPDNKNLYMGELFGTSVVVNTTTFTQANLSISPWLSGGMVINANGSRLYVATQTVGVQVVNPTTNTKIATIATNPSNVYGLSLSADGSTLYAALGNNTVAVINTATNTVTSTITVGSAAESIGNFIATASGCNGVPTTFTITVNPSPTLTTSGTPAALSTIAGTASTSTNFSVSGTWLQGAVTATAPTGFEVSTDGNTFGSTATLTPDGSGNISSANVYIRLAAADAVGTYSGSVALTGANLTEVDVPTASSTVIPAAPTTAASNISFSNTTASSTSITWTPGNGSNEAVFIAASPAFPPLPVNNTEYTANTTLGTGSWQCVFNGSGSSVNINGLAPGVTYHIYVFDYDGTSGSEQYLTSLSPGNSGSVTTLLNIETISFNASSSATYGDQDIVLNAASDNNGVPVTYQSDNTTVATIVNGSVHIIAAGSTNIIASQAGDATHYAAKDVSLPLTVSPASLTIGADSKTITYGDALPALSFTGNGYVYSDGPASLTTPPTLTTTATPSSLPGQYTITASGAVDPNYAIGYLPGLLTIKASADASLSGISLSTGTLSPAFSPSTTSYSVNVGNGATAITLTPTVTSGVGTVTVNGVSPATPVSLSVGQNVIPVAVTAQDGITKQTYTITVTRAPSANAGLTSIGPSATPLSPSFTPATTSYTLSVSNATTFVTVKPVTGDANATMTVNNTPLTSGTVSGHIALSIGSLNTISIAVTAQDGVTKKTYTITVTRAPATDATLSGLQLSTGTLSPVFAAGTTAYTASVSNATTSLSVTPTTNDPNATVTVNTGAATSGTAFPVTLAVGVNNISVAVTAQDGKTINTYTIAITRAPSANAGLVAIGASASPISPAFAPATTAYTLSVSNATATMTVKPVTGDAGATMTVNTAPLTSGTVSQPIALAAGKTTTISIVVTAQDKVTQKTYTIAVTRAAATDATLANLQLSSGTLSPAFAAGAPAYTASVNNATTTLSVTPTTNDPNATVTVNTGAATSGTAFPVALAVGSNSINVTVTAQDGTTMQTYTVTVTRAPSANAFLASIGPSATPLSPSFTPGNTGYSISVSNATASMTVKPVTSDAGATMTVNTTPLTSGTVSQPVTLAEGKTTNISIVVTAQDNSTKKTYTVAVTRAPSADATLTNLQLSSGTLSPVFAPGTNSYTANASSTTSTITVTPTTTDPNATVSVNNGTAITSGTASAPITLTVGANPVTVAVNAQDGTTKNTYSISVTKAPSTNALLVSMNPSVVPLSPVFAQGTTSYTLNVSNATTSVTVAPVTSDPNATMTVNNQPLASGATSVPVALTAGTSATITTVVTAQDKSTTRTYVITVNRPLSSDASLSAIKLSSGNVSPAVSSGATAFTATVSNVTSSITITPTVNDPNATITVNNTTATSGAAFGPIALTVGSSNVISLTVTAQDGTAQTYTVTVTRALSANDNLGTLGSSIAGLTPAFAAATTSYTLSVGASISSMTIKPVTVEPNATMTINGTPSASGASFPVTLATGNNTIAVQVTAQDGITNKTYTLAVNRAPGGADGFGPVSVTKPVETPELAEDGIVIHQAISPNGDGINDVLQIDNISQYPDNKLMIMNRNGQLVYEAKGYDNSSKSFDGHSSKNGQMQLPGTYFYQLDYTVKGIAKHKTGFIVLKY